MLCYFGGPLMLSYYQDSDNNTILTLLADFKPPTSTPYRSTQDDCYSSGAALRMAKLYYDRYPYIRDWANSQGKTALHTASMRGNEEVVQVRNPPSVQLRSTDVFMWLLLCSLDPHRCYVTSAPTLTCQTTKGTLRYISEHPITQPTQLDGALNFFAPFPSHSASAWGHIPVSRFCNLIHLTDRSLIPPPRPLLDRAIID